MYTENMNNEQSITIHIDAAPGIVHLLSIALTQKEIAHVNIEATSEQSIEIRWERT